MSANTDPPPRRRRRRKAEQRDRDRALVPVAVAENVGIPVAALASAMRAAEVREPLTVTATVSWIRDPESAPEWFTALRSERLAHAAEAECQAEERRQRRELAAEQSALAKLQSGGRFTDEELLHVQDWALRAAKDLVRDGPAGIPTAEERQVLWAVGVDAADHSTWLVHAGGCDGAGRQHCLVRIEQIRAQR
ncbi:hypothetical protein [Nocardia sp. CNY236]|uniref:hypothetical protein n=1 Tax=Nocardia sp. CNY236 TaxID=1169152 RepID=UPI0012DE3EAB|nr:hypothetical protein [Nocardia sp. CNY236]